MTGHGGPLSLALALARAALMSCAAFVLSAGGQDIAQPPEITPPNEPVQLCVTWGGGDATAWTGELRLDRGAFSNLQLVDGEADLAGSVWLDRSDMRIKSLSAQKLSSIEVSANAAADAKIAVRLAAGPQGAPFQGEVPLADLAKHPFQARLDDHGNSLEIRVLSAPSIHINISNHANGSDSLIFAPGTQLTFEALPVLPNNLHGTTLDVQTTLTPARRKDAVWRSENQRLAVPVSGQATMTVIVPLNVGEGVYTVHVSVSRSSGYFRDKFFPGAAQSIAERSFQITVFDSHSSGAGAPGKWEAVLEIDPTNPRWIERLPGWTRQIRVPLINNINLGMLGSLRAGAVNLPLGKFVELPATVAGADPHWQAYSLPLQESGTPHLLEIEYPADEVQHFGLSIVEPNAAGVIEGIQRDAGVYVETLGRSEAKHIEKHRLVFWPRTQSPLLVVTNQHPLAPAHFGQIRVLKRVGTLDGGGPKLPPTGRLVATYLSQALAAASLGASQTVVTASNSAMKSIGDTQTQFEAATRLAEYIRHSGCNSAVATVWGGGRAMYASTVVTSISQDADGGNAQPVGANDPLELTLQIFDRERLSLIPSLEFATPLPQLEELRRASDPKSSGIELVGPDGRTWQEVYGSRNGLAPYYNVLDPRVQQAMLEVVGELVRKYATHPAFGGIAVQLTSEGYTQLPPLEWGLDDATIDRFSRDTGIQIAGPGENRFAERVAALSGPNADAWRAWRSQQVAGFYARMAAVLNNGNTRKLLLTTEKLFANPQVAQRIRPNLLAENQVAATLLDLGLDRAQLERNAGVILCPTQFIEPMMPLVDRAIDLELNATYARWNATPVEGTQSAAVIYHPALPFRVAGIEKASPYRIAGELRQQSEPLPSGGAVRRAYVQALLQGDPAVLVDGGETLPLGQEETLCEVRTIISQLPVGAQFSDISKQSMVARTYSEQNQTTLVVMNTSPWRIQSQVTIEADAPAVLTPFSHAEGKTEADKAQQVQLAAGRQPWPVTLEAYEICAARVVGTSVRVVDVQAPLSNLAQTELKNHLAELSSRDLLASRDYKELKNPSFEPTAGPGPLPGWRFSSAAKTATAVFDATNPQEGKTSVYMRSVQGPASLDSDPFPVPPTGQLAMTVFVRGQNMAPTTALDLAFESTAGQAYWRRATVAGNAIQRPNQEWGKPFAIWVNDLPLDSHGQMRIRFRLSGPGEVWLDNVRLNDLLFPLTYYPNCRAESLKLLRRTHAPQAAFEAGELKDCMELLDGYWPRFVLAYTPPPAPPVAANGDTNAKAVEGDVPASTPGADKGDQPAPGLSDRIKRMVPILR